MKKKQRIHRTKYDDYLGFLASEYKFRFHAVACLVIEQLEEAGYEVKKMQIKDVHQRGIKIKWKLRKARGRGRHGRRQQSEGCCCVGCCDD
jgi:hypothetical protein